MQLSRFQRIVCLVATLVHWSHGCFLDHVDSSHIDHRAAISFNIAARDESIRLRQPPADLAIVNARIFNGAGISLPSTLTVRNGIIVAICTPTSRQNCSLSHGFKGEVYDAKNMTLLPGLIDSHAHPANVSHLQALTAAGITTTILAHCPSPDLCASLESHSGLTSIILGSFVATTPNSTHAAIVASDVPNPPLISNLTQIPSWVANQVSPGQGGGGAKFIKIIGSAPGPGLHPAAQTLLVKEAHRHRRLVVQHAASTVAFAEAITAKADQIHHSTLDGPLDSSLVRAFAEGGTVLCPTLMMMRAVAEQLPSPGPGSGSGSNSSSGSGSNTTINPAFAAAVETTRRLRDAEVAILVGTDANAQSQVPAGGQVRFGESMHDELENLVKLVGMTPAEALRAATKVPAIKFGELLRDRGAVEVGKRADLVLVEGDPTVDITVVRKVRRVWVGGVKFAGL